MTSKPDDQQCETEFDWLVPTESWSQTLRKKTIGNAPVLHPEWYLPGQGFISELDLHPDDIEESLQNTQAIPGEEARKVLARVKNALQAEENVRRFAARWDDNTVKIPFTEKARLPVPIDPLVSLMPGLGELISIGSPAFVFLRNAVKAGLPFAAYAKAGVYQGVDAFLHTMKYSLVGVPVQVVADWFFSALTGSTHDFTQQREKRLEEAVARGIASADLEEILEQPLARMRRADELAQVSRKIKRKAVEGATDWMLDKKVPKAIRKDVEGVVQDVRGKFLDLFYPLLESEDEDEKR